MVIDTGMLENGTNTSTVPSVDMVQTSMSSKTPKRMSKSRHIIMDDYTFWCDATLCDKCPVRYKCFTSRGDIVVSATKEILEWRLRDGSSKDRKY